MSAIHELTPSLTCVISAGVDLADRQALLDLFARSSPRTRRDRFHHALSVFPASYLDDILTGRQFAVAARDACHPENFGKVFGLASAAPVEPGTAEFAVWVDDAWQGRGVGSLLTRAILEQLARSGVRTAIGIVEPGNLAVRRMIQRIAPQYSIRAEADVLVISVPLAL
ncbi:acetyltransferase (GNAT) family protein [Kribbella pratensis]|uniref:Acetyltransferase (GNAT) family protein n=1 Tax=Kribbella pratensis TaxID=2512112 RepID=A0ABY2FLF3_9ACTN|nr:GNAT family N-acetyltransferase [Kribbella pratensis]TDW93445.1 acetyltransferase (GNAT) family protein [Kribbella pratensis]